MAKSRTSCKICGCRSLKVFRHTALCTVCGILLFFPYPTAEELARTIIDINEKRKWWLKWYYKSSFRNHTNFTNMLRFAMEDYPTDKNVDVLDYGGGGGQFALVVLSHFPNAKIWITDKDDDALLLQYRCINRQIPFALFPSDLTKFDFIFLNDVFEHVDAPKEVLVLLAKKVKTHGRIFIDTPKTFWIYPLLRATFKSLYEKLCIGTVNNAHLQIWSRRSFKYVVNKADLKLMRYKEISEFTMPADYYLKNMGISSSFGKVFGRIFYLFAHLLAKNKIIAVLSRADE